MVSNRIQSVDVIRLIAITAVIALHTNPFNADLPKDSELYQYLDIVINQLARFAVPFFFVISGYFWGVKVRRDGAPLALANRMGKRIGVVFIFWSLIYLIPFDLADFNGNGASSFSAAIVRNMTDLAHDPVTLLMQGSSVHLWFLVALLFSVYIAAFFIDKQWIKSLVIFSLLLYIIGLLAKSYADTPIGIDISFNTRNGPFFGTLFFVTGYVFSGFKVSPRWFLIGLLVTAVGYLLHFSEIFFIWKIFGTRPGQDYVIGTWFMGGGTAMIALSNHRMLQIPSLATIGRMTLGIYVIHVIFVDLLRPIDRATDAPLWEISYVLLVLLLSIVSVYLLSKNKLTQKIIL